MGYSTEFTGKLEFANEVTAKQLAKLNTFLGEDCRDHPEWGATNMTYIDLQLTDDFTGLEWDGSEKTYDLTEKVNLIIEKMRDEFPDFELKGELMAQGEDMEDRWKLKIERGKAVEVKIQIMGRKCKCPHCGEDFILEDLEDEGFSYGG
jgi:hypothetical protein